jgi:hypothetical protein
MPALAAGIHVFLLAGEAMRAEVVPSVLREVL